MKVREDRRAHLLLLLRRLMHAVAMILFIPCLATLLARGADHRLYREVNLVVANNRDQSMEKAKMVILPVMMS